MFVSKHFMTLSILFCIVGLALVFLSSVAFAPYDSIEHVRVDASRVRVDESFTIHPRTINSWERYIPGYENSTIVQLDLNATSEFRFRILSVERNQTVFVSEERMPHRFFWTAPYTDYFNFVFDNPYEKETTLDIVITEYYVKHVEDAKVRSYRPLLDQSNLYLGITLIIGAIILDVGMLSYEEIQNRKRQLSEGKFRPSEIPPVGD